MTTQHTTTAQHDRARQHDTNEPPAFKLRIAALLIDYLVILGWMAILALACLTAYLLRGSWPDLLGLLGPYRLQALCFAGLTLPVAIYHFCTEAGKRHATIGKRVLGLTVRDVSGGPAHPGQIALRTVIKFLPWEMAHFFIWQLRWRYDHPDGPGVLPAWVTAGLIAASLIPYGYIAMVALSKLRRGPHDVIAGTRVAV